MLNCEASDKYIEAIMSLSQSAQNDLQNMIMRSRGKLQDLISQSDLTSHKEGMYSDATSQEDPFLQIKKEDRDSYLDEEIPYDAGRPIHLETVDERVE